MEKTVYYSISLVFPDVIPGNVLFQQNGNQLFLSSNGRLVGLGKMAHLGSRELAKEFLAAYLPRLHKRYGTEVVIEVAEWSCVGKNMRLQTKIKKDSLLAREWLESGFLASNSTPTKGP